MQFSPFQKYLILYRADNENLYIGIYNSEDSFGLLGIILESNDMMYHNIFTPNEKLFLLNK